MILISQNWSIYLGPFKFVFSDANWNQFDVESRGVALHLSDIMTNTLATVCWNCTTDICGWEMEEKKAFSMFMHESDACQSWCEHCRCPEIWFCHQLMVSYRLERVTNMVFFLQTVLLSVGSVLRWTCFPLTLVQRCPSCLPISSFDYPSCELDEHSIHGCVKSMCTHNIVNIYLCIYLHMWFNLSLNIYICGSNQTYKSSGRALISIATYLGQLCLHTLGKARERHHGRLQASVRDTCTFVEQGPVHA